VESSENSVSSSSWKIVTGSAGVGVAATISSISACIDATSASASASRPVTAPSSWIWR
jgi:electron transfer flavoprotein alpha subunit